MPDGSGAVIDLSVPDDGFREVSIPVYGEDITAENSEDTTGTAIFPVFGVKRATGAFIAIIRDGDALATIKADRGSVSDCNKVYSEYRITNSSRMVINGEDNELFSSEAYDGKVTICYRFLSETNANFNGMSISCREQLIRDGILSTRVVEKQEHLPLNVSVIGAVDQYIDTFSVRFRTARVLSGFEETMDMLMQMKAKGIDSLNVRYIGMFSGGSNQNDLAGVTLNRELGSHSKYRELCAYADSMKFSIFANLNVLSAAVGTVEKESGQATNILSADASYVEENNLCRFNDYISTVYSKNLLSPGYIKEAVDSFTKNTSNVEIDGICIDDAGSILYSDFGETYYNREEAKDVISEDVAPLTTNRGGMVSNGNMYMIKQADYIIDMPVADDDYSASYTPVPFLQMVLHGTVEYSLEAINTSEDSTESFLKSIEYGAIPSFVFTYTDDSYTNEMGVHYYADWLTDASECYTEANNALYNLVDVRMVNNYSVAEDVKCTEYEDGTLIYVNYSDTDQSVDGVTVKANSFTVV